jgi:hypothetical protein
LTSLGSAGGFRAPVSRSLRTLLRSDLIDEISADSGVSIWAMDGRASVSSIIPSAINAKSANGLSGCDNRPIWTFEGRRCRKSSRRSSLSDVPCNCCKRRSSCDGFRSPNFSACKSCWIFRRLERDTRSVSVALSTSNGFVEGGVRIRSRTSVAASGDKAATTWANLVPYDVIFFTVYCASTCANQSSGSEGQNGGILTATAFVATTFVAVVGGGVSFELLDEEGVVIMMK